METDTTIDETLFEAFLYDWLDYQSTPDPDIQEIGGC